MKPFYGVRKVSGQGLKLTFRDNRELECTYDHRIRDNGEWKQACELKIGDLGIVKIDPSPETEFYDPVEIPGSEYISCNLVHHNCNVIVVDECLDGDTLVKIKDIATDIIESKKISDLYNINHQNLLVETNEGFKKFETVTQTEAGSGLKITFDDAEIKCTLDHKFWQSNEYIKAKDLRLNDVIDGHEVIGIETIPGDIFYDIFNVEGHHYTANGVEVSNCAYLNPLSFEEFCDGILPSQSSLTWKKTIFISTANGLNHFYQMVKGARQRKQVKGVTLEQVEDLKKEHHVLDVKRYDDLYDVTLDEPANGHRLIACRREHKGETDCLAL